MILSGAAVISKVLPLCPNCPPGFFPVGLRKLWFLAGRFSSLDGAMELLRLSLGFSYLDKRSRKVAFSLSSWTTRFSKRSKRKNNSDMILSLSMMTRSDFILFDPNYSVVLFELISYKPFI
jgi:hypothetical protein